MRLPVERLHDLVDRGTVGTGQQGDQLSLLTLGARRLGPLAVGFDVVCLATVLVIGPEPVVLLVVVGEGDDVTPVDLVRGHVEVVAAQRREPSPNPTGLGGRHRGGGHRPAAGPPAVH